ncbi:MAG: hypothetical protein BIFFINMI_00846 [Phycisphaerae bacterium]|nr:hypothetical protein [Phycisphaerae bacterium]
MTNVLLTSAGRRSYLVHYFRQALAGQGRVICANMYPDTPAMLVADEAVVVPPSYSDSYIPTILELCRSRQVGVICSLHDWDTFVLSRHLADLRAVGAVPVIPDAEWGRICLDKYECGQRLEQAGIAVPWATLSLEEARDALSDGRLRLPVLTKARIGFGSLGLHRCQTLDELRASYDAAVEQLARLESSRFFDCPADQSVLIQQAIQGPEYCVDVVNDLAGRYACHFAIRVVSMRAGETDQVVTVDPLIAGEIPRRLGALTRHPGIWGVDVLDDGGTLRVIDVNPRFTGDYPFHHLCGANIPAAILAWACGEQPDPGWLKAEVGVRAYKDLVPMRMPRGE